MANYMFIDVNFKITVIDFDYSRKMEDEIAKPLLVYGPLFSHSEINGQIPKNERKIKYS